MFKNKFKILALAMTLLVENMVKFLGHDHPVWRIAPTLSLLRINCKSGTTRFGWWLRE